MYVVGIGKNVLGRKVGIGRKRVYGKLESMVGLVFNSGDVKVGYFKWR